MHMLTHTTALRDLHMRQHLAVLIMSKLRLKSALQINGIYTALSLSSLTGGVSVWDYECYATVMQ